LPNLLRVRGRNLVQGRAPRVSIGGEAVSVLKASDDELVLAPLAHQMSGMMMIETGADDRVETAFDLTRYARPQPAPEPPRTPADEEEP
jgi:hypothetical protein